MRIKYKVWSLATAIISIIIIADIFVGYSHIESSIQEELNRDAEDIRAILMSTRRVYQKQFIESGLPIDENTVGFLPAHALSHISVDFQNWSNSGLKFNTVSDLPRNANNRANSFEQDAMAWFRANPQAKSRLVEINKDDTSYYHYTSPVWIEKWFFRVFRG